MDEVRDLARRRIPRVVFDAIDGAAADEVTLRANRAAFDRVWLRPRGLADVRRRDLTTTVFGDRISMPLMLDPCGFARMADSEAELAPARAAGAAGTIFVLSCASSYSLDEVAAAATGPLWYQLYITDDHDQTVDRVTRARDAGYRVLCVTIDTPGMPRRERDLRNRLSLPLKVTPRLVLAGVSRPRWSKDFALGKVGDIGRGNPSVNLAMARFTGTVLNTRPVTAEDLVWLREHWPGKLVVKGVQRADECAAMLDLGVDGFIVSNHGGRNLDGVRPAIAVLPEVVDAVDGRAEVFLDSGVRRGTDVLKALALGARACLIGRPYMFGLAAGGESGVARVLDLFREEMDNAMLMAGCATIADLDARLVETERSFGSTPRPRVPVPAEERT